MPAFWTSFVLVVVFCASDAHNLALKRTRLLAQINRRRIVVVTLLVLHQVYVPSEPLAVDLLAVAAAGALTGRKSARLGMHALLRQVEVLQMAALVP